MNVGSLFSGIGGIDLGLERAGMHVAWQCEADPYCRAVLRKHWPLVPCYDDVRTIHHGDAEPVDVLAGGFPCQPVSDAGLKRAQLDERWLWPEFARLVGLLRPRFMLVENVPGLLARGMGDVLGDLAALGYDAEWDCIPACAIGANHERDRVWVVAYPQGQPERARLCTSEPAALRRGRPSDDGGSTLAHAGGDRLEGRIEGRAAPRPVGRSGAQAMEDAHGGAVEPRRVWGRAPQAGSAEWWAVEPDVGRVAHGVPKRLDRLAALGNAVVPQVAEWIGRRMMEAT